MRWRFCRSLFFFLLMPVVLLAAGKKETGSSSMVASAVRGTGIRPTVVIDAGHGGRNLGARGQNPYCEEKRLTLQTALLVQKYLSQLGYRVLMTRASDFFIPLPRRVEIANQARADLFISIHYNFSDTPAAQGIEVFFSEDKNNRHRSVCSRRLASALLNRMVRRTKAASRGTKNCGYYVIRETEMPAVLIEGGFLSNSQELSLLKDPEYLDHLARGIADGVDRYFFLQAQYTAKR